jgi:hypothetical protein
MVSQMNAFDRSGAPHIERLHQRDQSRLELTAEDGIAAVGQQVVGVQRGVEPVEAHVAAGIHAPHFFSRLHAEPEGRVHGDGDGHEPRARHAAGIEWLDGEVESRGREAGALEKGERRGQGQRLVAELIAGQQEDRPLFSQRGRVGLRHGGSLDRFHVGVRLIEYTCRPDASPDRRGDELSLPHESTPAPWRSVLPCSFRETRWPP